METSVALPLASWSARQTHYTDVRSVRLSGKKRFEMVKSTR